MPHQVLNFVTGALQGDLGDDFVSDVAVTTLVCSAAAHGRLAVASLLLAWLGVPLGVYAATRPNTLGRPHHRRARGLAASPSRPTWRALPPAALRGALGVLPAIGVGRVLRPGRLPAPPDPAGVALAITWIGYLARLVRASMLEVLNANYIRTAHAFGLRERVIFYKYALKNAIIPTVAVLGVGLGTLMGGAVFVEVIFARPGLGTLIFDSIQARNYPIVRGGVLVVAVLFVLANLLADLSYRFLDPRIRAEQGF